MINTRSESEIKRDGDEGKRDKRGKIKMSVSWGEKTQRGRRGRTSKWRDEQRTGRESDRWSAQTVFGSL